MRSLTKKETQSIYKHFYDILKESIIGEIGRFDERYTHFFLNLTKKYPDADLGNITFGNKKQSLLHILAKQPLISYESNLKVIKRLINAGCSIITQNTDKKTPLDIAVSTGNIDIVNIFLKTSNKLSFQNRIIEYCAYRNQHTRQS